MTVCIAAICTYQDEPRKGWPMIVMVSDRKYTVGTLGSYEPTQTKNEPLTPRIVAMVAGIISDHAGILTSVKRALTPEAEGSVESVADLYSRCFAEFRRRQAERAILAPIGLDLVSLPAIHKDIAGPLFKKLRDWEFPNAAIIAGLDANHSPHLFEIQSPGQVDCMDAQSYAVIGSGSLHAAGYFMRHSYTRAWSPAKALLLAYAAKKHAEVDPYVGRDTDVYVIGPGINQYNVLDEMLFEQVGIEWGALIQAQQIAAAESFMNMEALVTEHLSKAELTKIEHQPAQIQDPAQES